MYRDLHFFLYPSFQCNLTCKHCSIESSPHTYAQNELTSFQMQRVINQFKAVEPNCIILSGGEPLLYKDIQQILQSMISNRINLIIETNALLITDQILSILASGLKRGLKIELAISMDGGDQETYEYIRGENTFNKLRDNLEKISQYKIPFNLQCVLHKKNIHTIYPMVKITNKFKALALAFAFVSKVGRGKENFEELGLDYDDICYVLKTLYEIDYGETDITVKLPPAMIPPEYFILFKSTNKKLRLITSCHFPTLGIMPNGDISICSISQKKLNINLGNILNNSIDEILNCQDYKELKNRFSETPDLSGICNECVFKLSCRGSCRVYAFMEYGNFKSSHPLCVDLHKNGKFPEIYRAKIMEDYHGA